MNKCQDWTTIRLGEILSPSNDRVSVEAGREYPNFGLYGFGRGLFKKKPINGTQSSAVTLYRAKAEQFVYSRLFAFEGAYGVVSGDLDGYFVSNEFPLFNCNMDRVVPRYLGWLFRFPMIWTQIAQLTTGMGSRRQRVKPEALLDYSILLPALDEQHRIVAKIDRLAAKIEDSASAIQHVDELTKSMLISAYRRIADNAPRRRMGEVAPLIRRPATVDPAASYPQVSVRSFGKGTFHNPPLLGSEITWEKPHLVKRGDILVSNIKAWEGAIAVADEEDDGRFGSHRYLTFVPVTDIATAPFLCFHLLSPEGLLRVGEASPGSADRNRTLSSKAMIDIQVPVPPYDRQLWFDRLLAKARMAFEIRSDAAAIRQAMLPAILDRAFKGAL